MKIQSFTKSYGGRRVLDLPGLELERGKIYGVIGANGSGKSTFAKVLAGITSADQPGPKTEKGLSLGYMPQKNYAFRMSVKKNITRMALARLMMKDFDLLILDEPTAAMDMESSLKAEGLMADYCRRTGCTLVLITHSLPQAERVADMLLFFHEGQLLEQGEKQRLLAAPACPWSCAASWTFTAWETDDDQSRRFVTYNSI